MSGFLACHARLLSPFSLFKPGLTFPFYCVLSFWIQFDYLWEGGLGQMFLLTTSLRVSMHLTISDEDQTKISDKILEKQMWRHGGLYAHFAKRYSVGSLPLILIRFSDNRAFIDNKSLPHAQLQKAFHRRTANLLPTTLKISGVGARKQWFLSRSPSML